MLKKNQLIAVIFLVILLSQCKKIKIVPDVAGTPVFFVSLSIGGTDSLEFTAGKDDYALFTSYEQGADGVYTFIGEFKQETSQTDSLASLRFEIRDQEANPIQVDINEALNSFNYLYFNNDLGVELDSLFIVNFSASSQNTDCLSNLPSTAFSWDFGDGQLASGAVQNHRYENTIDRVVKLNVDLGFDEEAVFEQTIRFESGVFTPPCSLILQDTLVQNNTWLELMASGTGGMPPYSYQWHDGSVSSSYGVLIPALDSISNFYSVTLTDSTGCTSTSSGNIPINPDDLCAIRFAYQTALEIDTILINDAQFSTITIIYTDFDGKEYRSDVQAQNNAFFAIQNVDDFANNENGEKTKKIDIDFSCELFSIDGLPSINVSSEGAVIGVAYPE